MYNFPKGVNEIQCKQSRFQMVQKQFDIEN